MQALYRKPSAASTSLIRLWFSVGLPILLLLVFLGKQVIDFNSIGLSNGFAHPLTGWDHLVTMLAVGIWAAQLRGRAIWMLPLAFVSVMSLGGLAGASGLHLPNVDGVILLSCAVFSVLITRKIRFSSKINVLIVAFFAFFHGFAHGQEISTSASLLSYTLGFMLATLLLHGAGILVAKLVVLAVTCLLSTLFSQAALAKYETTLLDQQQQHQLILNQNQQRADYANYSWLAPPDLAGLSMLDDTASTPSSHNDSTLSARFLQSIPIDSNASVQAKIQAEPPFAGFYVAKLAKKPLPTLDNHTLRQVYPCDSADCRNLDFKQYFVDINRTPGKQLLSCAVGLTSPPDLLHVPLVSYPFQTSANFAIAANIQLNPVSSHLGNVSHHTLAATLQPVTAAGIMPYPISNFGILRCMPACEGLLRHSPNYNWKDDLNPNDRLSSTTTLPGLITALTIRKQYFCLSSCKLQSIAGIFNYKNYKNLIRSV